MFFYLFGFFYYVVILWDLGVLVFVCGGFFLLCCNFLGSLRWIIQMQKSLHPLACCPTFRSIGLVI